MLTILGQDGVPLSYMIRESGVLEYTIELQNDYYFKQLYINCVPLTGLTYEIDSRKSHQTIHSFIHGEIAETCINPKERNKDG